MPVFYYLKVLPAALASIRTEGFWYAANETLPLATDLPKGAAKETYLVVDAAQVAGDRPEWIPPSAFLNLSPYLPVKKIIAAGGYILRDRAGRREVLVMYRRGHWDLPKGKRDKGETPEQTAIREVCEEIGIASVQILKALGETLHAYPSAFKPRYEVKTTYWYAMKTTATHFKPQVEEDIEALEWIPLSELVETLGYDTLKRHAQTWLPCLETLEGLPLD